MDKASVKRWAGGVALALLALGAALLAASDPKAAIVKGDRIQAADLAATLASKTAIKPELIQIGFYELYRQGHIPGSAYAGPAARAEGLEKLAAQVKGFAHDKPMVLYCGCCPWGHCPNVLPAYKLMRKLGFSNVKVLEMKKSFGEDWSAKGYPTVEGD